MTDFEDSLGPPRSSGITIPYNPTFNNLQQADVSSRDRSLWQYGQEPSFPQNFSHRYARLQYSELEEELRNERVRRDRMEDSTQTLFQEQREGWPLLHEGLDEYDPPQHLKRGYVSPFALEAAPANEQSFMEWYPKGDAIITFPDENGELQSIGDICLFMIEDRCPLLGMAFEHSRSGPQLHLEVLTQAAAFPFLRFLYTGSYALTTASGDQSDDVPTSVLLHCQLYRLGDIYDLPELRSEAYVNVLRQCEFGCSSPHKPIDLCNGIQYIYSYLSNHEQLIDAIVNYCVSRFERHRLAEDTDFKKLAYTIRPFHRALCRNSMSRKSEDDIAAAIIQLSYSADRSDKYASRQKPTSHSGDVVYHFHCDDDDDANAKSKKRKSGHIFSAVKSALSLPVRSKRSKSMATPVEATPSVGEGVSESLDTSESRNAQPATHESVVSLALRPKESQTVSIPADAVFHDVPLETTSDLEANGTDSAPSSDEDYDIVARPATVEALSTDESEVDSNNKPRPSSSSKAQAVVVDADSDSDSDWTVV
ncbi:hypothetical protein LTR56_016290 [Elasticomyces elasticus]|nr:hypothetical protein LTR56_016290 [Elasticomyces elasticus]KAK3642852.1 hypothetical protein LTR22_015910 [Elasticomyces elasticus]KAK4920726.1 hypothetical protein LTR49_011802 [Elasticomyces elasticus]KAK5754140.1 hypothetical protein LTS12_015782 [Elasticomyces elasticus]